ncbi:single-stranded-DNA-specific exonuclease RecJ [Vicingaceae bacterium]|nr:single-stranded-DNA-specific exonuclease RecJ [Vicingaceae bacterium]MDB4060861.1 single-stranded-DNA-specific exonuclease RecJ [Vicingaceae bacterium]MDB4083172.1 single-stranded-DNA-specific exonuclease RecJ [Vicingaceae bacterium]MDC1450802.1 single-stranded-DNA-specific exonuclease RecJ [Vicingaceae bacterium]
MEKRWTLLPQAEKERIQKLSSSLNNLNETLCNILINRGIDDFEKAKTFFRPHTNQLHSPFLMKNMDKAVARLQKAIKNNENILIYGDYDVDGTTSVTLVYSYISSYYKNLSYYIPNRYTEGYGISYQGIAFAEENDVSLIIALDCGIKAVEKIDYANKKNIDFIICDHHLPGDTVPDAIAVLDPKQVDCEYPYKELSGCGVGFKFMQAWAEEEKHEVYKLFSLVDILAVSICADIVAITGENRVLCHYGVQKLNKNPQPGFKAMLEIANNKKKELTVTDIVFTLAPRINAAGRIESGNKAVEVMLSQNPQLADEGGNYIDIQNTDRKELDKTITKEALAMIEADEKLKARKTTVLFKNDWHKGVIGIVASRCIENYYRPTIILTESKGMAAGSARSVKGFSVYNAIEECSELLEQFGGHKYAAGMTMPLENVPAFQKKFEEVVASTIDDDLLIPEIEIDAVLDLADIETKFYRVLKQFAPFGPLNMKPTFVSKGVYEKGQARIVGDNHLKLEVVAHKNNTKGIAGIAFNMGKKMDLLKNGEPFDVVYHIEENEWQGRTTLQLIVQDIKKGEN